MLLNEEFIIILPEDGREFVVTNHQAVKIQAEEGRSVVGVDIAPFIQNLPQNKSTTNFSTTSMPAVVLLKVPILSKL